MGSFAESTRCHKLIESTKSEEDRNSMAAYIRGRFDKLGVPSFITAFFEFSVCQGAPSGIRRIRLAIRALDK